MTNSLKRALCAIILASSVSTGFAQDNATLLEQARQAAEQASNTVRSGFRKAADKAADYSAQGANWLKGTSAYQTTTDKAGQLYGSVAEKSNQYYNAAKDSVRNAYTASSDKVGELYATAAEKALKAKKAISASKALAWVDTNTPEGIKSFIKNHPYLSFSAVIVPVTLFIGYKWGESQNESKTEKEGDEDFVCIQKQS